MSPEEFEPYNALVNSLTLAYSLDPTIFENGTKDFDCMLASIAFAAAAVSLAALEVGTGGLATAAVIIGYVAASTAWVRACNPNINEN